MQYLRSVSGSVSKTWNSINPATLSGAIDVIVVEHEDGVLACSPFHVRFGKFSLLRPHEKKVEFKVNDVKRDFPMKLGEGGEAFFVFETTTSVPAAMQTSPVVSPLTSPEMRPCSPPIPPLSEAENLELSGKDELVAGSSHQGLPASQSGLELDDGSSRIRMHGEIGGSGLSSSLGEKNSFPADSERRHNLTEALNRANTDHALPSQRIVLEQSQQASGTFHQAIERSPSPLGLERSGSTSPQSVLTEDARTRAINLSKKLWTSNIPAHVTDQGDLMLDMNGYKSSEEEALRAEVIARKILSEELEGHYDIGSLMSADEKGNLWIYRSEEAKEQANKHLMNGNLHDFSRLGYGPSTDAISDPGYHSDDNRSESSIELAKSVQHYRRDSDSGVGLPSPPPSMNSTNIDSAEATKSFAKTLRLTSEQLKDLELKPGQNSMSFTVNRATCTANLWLWKSTVPIIISDIDGTITKSDALGHVLNYLGRDWTHLGVAKLYTEIAENGYNFLYLTSRSVGQADTTRAYLTGVVQDDGYRLPKGPVIMSPDRTMAALRREVYLRKPEVFKMACLRDIMALFQGTAGSAAMFVDTAHDIKTTNIGRTAGPFYAGFGNRLTDAISYRSVNIPSTRIFTINTSSEVSLDLSTLSSYRTGYSTMREIVNQYFPPVSQLVKAGGEEYTDFNYWRERPLDIADFSASESEDEEEFDEEDVDEEEDDPEVDDDDDDEPDDEDRYLPPQTPMYTPGILSEDEYATQPSSAYSASGRPSLDMSRGGESLNQSAAPSVYGGAASSRPTSAIFDEHGMRDQRLRRLQRELTMTPSDPRLERQDGRVGGSSGREDQAGGGEGYEELGDDEQEHVEKGGTAPAADDDDDDDNDDNLEQTDEELTVGLNLVAAHQETFELSRSITPQAKQPET